MNASPQEMNEIRKDHRQTGERLASIETLLKTVSDDIKEIKEQYNTVLEKLELKADNSDLVTIHDRITNFKKEVASLETEFDELGKEVTTLQASRKSDFFWMGGIAAFLGILFGVGGAIIAALIQK